jgi:gamma-glutamyltranspeptidase/glutathione hydrolase
MPCVTQWLKYCLIKTLQFKIKANKLSMEERMKSPTRLKLLVTIIVCPVFMFFSTKTGSCGRLPFIGFPGGSGGVVTTSEPNAARIGADVLKAGGNAIDAAVAVQFALNVVEPQSSGIGGGGFMMIHLARENKTFIIDSREKAPAAATPDMFQLASDPTQTFEIATVSTSGISVGVPGTLLGVVTALDEWGTISLAEALAPAIQLARDGFRVGTRLAGMVRSSRLDFEPDNPLYEEARSVFRPGGVPLQKGKLFTQPDLAKTFELIAEQGTDVFYKGEIAEAIVDTQANAARTVSSPDDQEKLFGRMTLEDLSSYNVSIRSPISDYYRGYKIMSMGPPSSGGLTVLQILKLIERFDIGDSSQGFGFGEQRTLHVMIEAMRLAFADRAVWMGDEDVVEVPKKGLLDDEYIAMRSALIDPDLRQEFVEADDPRPFESSSLKEEYKLASVAPEKHKGNNTTHFTIVDYYGNIVSYTTTIESGWGTGLMVPGYGFMLNSELTCFNFMPAYNPDPNNYNPGANDAAPNKKPRSSMSPTMIFRSRRPLAAFGSPGASTIIDTVVNIASNLIDHNLSIQEAVDAPRIAQTSANGPVNREIGFSEEVMTGLADLGHYLLYPTYMGSVQAVVIGPANICFGAADRRRDGRVMTLREKY